jgi:5'-methylthioadenosine phosphorylase
VFALTNRQETIVQTPFGPPSDKLVTGRIQGVECVLLSRHAKGHKIMPSRINYRANIHALKAEGCTHILNTSACGSLQEEIRPGTLAFPNQFIDRTTKREQTFYDDSCDEYRGVCHMPMYEPFCPHTRQILIDLCQKLDIDHYGKDCTTLTIEGPRFSSRSESKLFKSWGAHIIGMTTVPEVVLAKEAGLCYATIALPTDYDSWREAQEGVGVQMVMQAFKENIANAMKLINEAVVEIARQDWTERLDALKSLVQENVMIDKS